jgi:hypothetical protein
MAGHPVSGDFALNDRRRFRLKLDNPVGVLRFDLAKICVKSLEIAAELSVELPPRLAGFFNDWVFHVQPSMNS